MPEHRSGWKTSLAGRPSRADLALLTVGVLVEVGLGGFWLTTGRTAIAASLQVLAVLATGLTVLLRSYRRYRTAFETGLARSAVERERDRLAGELHDVLGHELSIIALRAAAIQLRSTDEVRATADALRQDVARATVTLHETVTTMHHAGAEADEASSSPQTVEALVTRAVASGAHVSTTGSLPGWLPRPLERAAAAVVREGLTNATRHAPGAEVGVVLGADDDAITVSVTNPVAGRAPAEGGTGSGLRRMQRRVELLGGSLTWGVVDGGFVLRARLPTDLSGVRAREAPAGPGTSAGRPVPALLRATVVPVGAACVLLAGFYAWATHGATLEEEAGASISVGMPRATALSALPDRQAPVRLVPAPDHVQGWECRYYTDGNAPFGMATFEVCFAADAVVRVSDLRSQEW